MNKQSGVVLAVALIAGGTTVWAADQTIGVDVGKRAYESKCASCHGVSGKGDGPFAANLIKAPSDLTVLAKKNNGVFPVMQLETVIDGRMQTALHGPRDMPVWGQEFAVEGGKDWPVYMGVPFNPEVFVRNRIMSLIDYIARIQTK